MSAGPVPFPTSLSSKDMGVRGCVTDKQQCRWIAGKISEILGNEDDVVIELCFNLLEGSRFVCLTCWVGLRLFVYGHVVNLQLTIHSISH